MGVLRGMPLLIFCVALATIGGIAPAWAASFAANTEDTTLSMAGRNIELEPARFASGVATDTFTFRVRGPTPQFINVELLDIVDDPNGQRILLPAGSTAHSLEGVVSVGAFNPRYEPNGSTQSFSVDISAENPRDEVRYGGVRVTMTPDIDAARGSSVENVSGIFLVVLVVPEGFDGRLPNLGETTITTSSLTVKPLFQENLFELLLPDIPGVVNRGPVAIDVDQTNESDNPVFLTTSWAITSGGESLLSSSTNDALLFSKRNSLEEVTSMVEVPGTTRPINVLPSFGVVEVKMSSEARLGQNVLSSTERTTSFLVLRWKEPFAIALALAIIWLLLWSSRKTMKRKSSEGEAGSSS